MTVPATSKLGAHVSYLNSVHLFIFYFFIFLKSTHLLKKLQNEKITQLYIYIFYLHKYKISKLFKFNQRTKSNERRKIKSKELLVQGLPWWHSG